jgi:nicotinate phosphoribosyltransferase
MEEIAMETKTEGNQLPIATGIERSALDSPLAGATLTTTKLAEDRLRSAVEALPESHVPFTDRYFRNTALILKAEGINPWVRGQVMIRKGPGEVGGMDEALAVLSKYSPVAEHGAKIRALKDGDRFDACETLMTIEAPIQDFVELETMYLGTLSAGTTRATDHVENIDLEEVERRMRACAEAAGDRPIIYMGARHWRFDEDPAISMAAFRGGATDASTEAGASMFGKRAVGTIPHVLENVMGWRYGKDRAVVEATLAFDRRMDPAVPRIALIDYNNREVDDSVATARALNGRLTAVRVDTCGENIAQGALLSPMSEGALKLKAQGIALPELGNPDAKFWYGNGVTVTGVYALRKALDEAGFPEVKIVLSSGFGDATKIRAFMRAEKLLGVRLADVFGVGGVFSSRQAKMDIVAAGESLDALTPISKTGRSERPNSRLVEQKLPLLN